MKFGRLKNQNAVTHRIIQSGWREGRTKCGAGRYTHFGSYNATVATIKGFDDPWEFMELSEEQKTLRLLAMGEKLVDAKWLWDTKPCGQCFPEGRRHWDAAHPHCDTCTCAERKSN